VEAKGGKGGSERRKRLSTESADDPYYDPSFDPNVKEGTPFPFRPSPKKDLPEHRGPADKRTDAIMSVCGYDPTIDRHLRNGRIGRCPTAQLLSWGNP
jgi:hypothetical protein